MDKFKEMLMAKMSLMEGKELRYGFNLPGTDKREIIKETIKRLEEYLDKMDKFPEDYAEKDENPKFQLSLELLKVNHNPLEIS